ncbi:Glu-tRNA(Gln) amidotransferase subunit GatD [Candidatus Methanosphaera massiliense]|uniref:Glu-tRNA(Gln) amidotransferase subunit GatD n=1 Tax=Methanosphaera TaxID=2316 RepID=UPI000DC3BCAC|nr:Glu-tRNA(Gln) amidotransferase subunit GatD [Candidatus Methanosphaera massiliense]MDD6286032.1 Glu-tRNA(Gln) amidotransferase subunit GatD [Methanobacteriaceae archaeon]MDE4077803.1 Glu-tRNA(Gln) amidotransferase subunit GatD [Candidatus Methanosphaera massiliense]RAP43915.1 MAG: glutamyl-tRNA(Gln) amidotransferase subunit D [Methanosphaera sp. SHI1033]
MAYEGYLKDFLELSNITVGDTVKITKPNVEHEGMLLEKPDYSNENTIIIKLDSGYNIGVDIQDAKIEKIREGSKPKIELDPVDKELSDEKDNVSILSTGGTVASVIDYKTGAVHPAFTADDLLRATPELVDYANINAKAIFNILSEDMTKEYWIKTAEEVYNEINNGADGVIIAHGTDTMHYTASALSFMIDTPVPIVLTGAQRSSDRPSSDAFTNLMSSVTAAKSDIAEVTICMHGTEDDTYCDLHRGTRARKMHTSRRDTFTSINMNPLAKIQNNKLTINDSEVSYTKRNENKLDINTDLADNVALIKSYPGMNPEIIDIYVDKGYDGLVIEGTGLGHCSDDVITSIGRATDEKIPVVITSQCIFGRTNLNVYSSGRRLLHHKVIPVSDMLSETAYTKLLWAAGQTDDMEEIRKIMQTNLKGEMDTTLSQNYFIKN